MKPKVYVTRKLPSPAMELLRDSCRVTLHNGHEQVPREELLKQVEGIDGLVCLATDRIDREIMEKADRLKVISTYSVGYEHIDVAEATRRGIYIGYTPDVLTEATADLAFALVLATARRVAEADRFVRAKKWQAVLYPMLLLGEPVWGATIGIVGMGRIGKAVATRAKGFSMRVLYNDPVRLSKEEEESIGAAFRELDELLGESDFVSLHTPLTGETFHLIDEKKLMLMKATAMLINTSRGKVVDESALYRALKKGIIGGAGIDVYENEPIGKNNPLLTLENVTLIPHLGSATVQARRKMAELAAKNLLSVLTGEPPVCWLNPEVIQVRSLSEIKIL